MDNIVDRVWTQAAFFDWAEAQEERYEFDGTRPVLMVNGTNNHSAIHSNLLFALRLRLRDSLCRVMGPDAGVATVGDTVRYPDVLVTCSDFSGTGRMMPGVVVVFEVTSTTSARLDRVVKVEEYAAVPSIRRYVIVESSFVGATVFCRASAHDGWTATALGGGGMLALPEIGIEVSVDDIYDRIEFG